MTEPELRQIAASANTMRMRVPSVNRDKFDIEFNDVFFALKSAKANHAEILSHWKGRVEMLSRESRCHMAPPCLIRKANEKTEEYIDRCYTSGGF